MFYREPWSDEETAELQRMLAVRLDFKLAATSLNEKFGTHRSRKSCSSHIYELAGRRGPARPRWSTWPLEHDALLRKMVGEGRSFSVISVALNSQFGASYTRNACIGRSRRITDRSDIVSPPKVIRTPEERRLLANKQKSDKRRAENPNIIPRYGHEARAKSNRSLFLSRGAATTSAEYRRHVPRLPKDMTRADLRAMLTQAVQNTAAMVVS